MDVPVRGEPGPVRLLIDAAKTDTLYRDLYLERGRYFLASRFPPDAYRVKKEMREELERLLAENVAAVERGEWERVRELTVRVKGLRSAVEDAAGLLELGRELYEPPEGVVDPFSPGIAAIWGGRGDDPGARVTAALERLQEEDPELSSLYRLRSEHFRDKSGSNTSADSSPRKQERGTLQQEAVRAAQRGDVDDLDRLLHEMEKKAALESTAGVAEGELNAVLSAPFPQESAARAAKLGFVAATVEARPEISASLHRWAWQPTLPEPRLTQDGHIRIAGIPDDRGYPADAPSPLRDMLDLFIIHPYVNSGGVRYLPLLVDETVLVEDFPEDGEQGGEILPLLDFSRRTGLSRKEIERSLLRHGPEILRERFALDPLHYRLVCIPPDLYCRLGGRFGWGKRQMWTHFDGYQLLKEGGFRALVGGDVRYGGIFDLCSISPVDERDGVVVRFAVVRRERLSAL